ESNESNNSSSGGPFACPDLVVTDLSPFEVVVRNIGNGGAGPSEVLIHGVGPISIGALGAGSAEKKAVSCKDGTKPVAHADATHQLLESTENKNTLAGPVW